MNAINKNLPGAYLVEKGLEDIRNLKRTKHSLLLLSAKTRIEALGILVENIFASEDTSLGLFKLLQEEQGNGAHSMFNALNRELISFLRASERELKLKNARTS